MRRGPEAASMPRVAAALKPGGADVCVELIGEVHSQDKVVVERAARGLKKISEADPGVLYPFRKKLLAEAFRAADVRVQWNLTIVLGRLPLKGQDKELAVDLMFERLQDRSGLNRTMAMQALMDLSIEDNVLRARVMPVVRESLESGTPAMQARARKLLGIKRER